jgi:hypothetical protein
LDIQRL